MKDLVPFCNNRSLARHDVFAKRLKVNFYMVRNGSPPQLLVEEVRLSEMKSYGFHINFISISCWLEGYSNPFKVPNRNSLMAVCHPSIQPFVCQFIHVLSRNSSYVVQSILLLENKSYCSVSHIFAVHCFICSMMLWFGTNRCAASVSLPVFICLRGAVLNLLHAFLWELLLERYTHICWHIALFVSHMTAMTAW